MMKTKWLILTLIYWQISFEKYVPKHLISLLHNFYFILHSRFLIIYKNQFSKDDFESRLCDQTQWLYIVKVFCMSQMNPKEFVHNTTYSAQIPYIAGHSL